MSEESFAALGRKQLELDTLHAEYDKLLGVFASVAAGIIDPKMVAVDLTARTWKVDPLPETTPE